LGLVLLAFHPIVELKEDVTQDRSTASPFLADVFQASQHAKGDAELHPLSLHQYLNIDNVAAHPYSVGERH